jgi:hypothetical protein
VLSVRSGSPVSVTATIRQFAARRPALYRWIVLGLLAAALPVVAQTVTASASVRTSHPRRFRVDGRRFSGEGCSARTVVPRIGYDLGARFEGLARNPRDYFCSPAPERQNTESGPLVSYAYVTIIYGTCDFSEGPCSPPLEIQDVPECARNPRSYRHNPGFPPIPGEDHFGDPLRLPAAPWIPALAFPGGTWVEVLAGRTNVVVYSFDYARAKRAANVLARFIAKREDPPSSARRLRADANQPGDGSACRTFRGAL